ncbi:hypothetical protein [Halomonas sp. YLGW01]|uniref:hypothetical protein n=1 Tax=Halomonas sp. YLGW01 TaxID=2773308 RepID=UPI00192D3DE5|nr:hypothetical protein [Halomonas sp. YLGW01]
MRVHSLRALGVLGTVTAPLLMATPALSQETDSATGLIIAEGWQVVSANCTVCHSAQLVTQNSGSRNHWQGLIRWMQDTQGLWAFTPEMEDTILDYLATHYGPKAGARRPAAGPASVAAAAQSLQDARDNQRQHPGVARRGGGGRH